MIETGSQLAAACREVAENYSTLYVLGAFGWPMNEENKDRCLKGQAFNARPDRRERIRIAAKDTFGFDCVCLIKALLWGWTADTEKRYGGAVYAANGVPDVGADKMIGLCQEVSEDFSAVEPGELLWRSGHVGIYIGAGLAVECTPKWSDGVQVTAVKNMGSRDGYNERVWAKHGRLPYVTYESSASGKRFALELRYLRMGMKGGDVRALQQLLISRGINCGSARADGIYGKNTQKAVQSFQSWCGIACDGVAGPQTMRRLLEVEV